MNKFLPGITFLKTCAILLLVIVLCGANVYSQTRCAFVNDSKQVVKFNYSPRVSDQDQVMYIPVVFHVVYNSTAQNISNDQIYSQLKVINEDFSKSNTDALSTREEFKSVAANVGIQFYLAEINNEIGVTRTLTKHGPFFNDDLHLTSSGGKDGWNTDHYLNVWVASLASGIFGYGTSPGTAEFKDGVAIHYEYFGKGEPAMAPYNSGRTLTHEIGHWLGLQHPWGTSGDCKTDDGLTDTPAQAAPSYGCSLTQVSCGVLNMVQNFMNTSFDGCMTLFTTQQKEVMRNVLTTDRPNSHTDQPVITGLEDLKEDEELVVVYPNPVVASPILYLHFSGNQTHSPEVCLVDMVGKEVRNYKIIDSDRDFIIDLKELNNGIYFARVSEGGRIYSKKIQLNLK